jgi:hypothetical protein
LREVREWETKWLVVEASEAKIIVISPETRINPKIN